MLRRSVGVLLGIACCLLAASANAVTGGLTLLPTGATDGKVYQAKFAIGLSTDSGKNWVSSATLNQSILFKASLDADPAHANKKADVFVVELYNGKYTMLTSTGVWQSWSGKVAELKPWLDDTTLLATQDLTIYQGNISTEGDHKLYIGYLSSVGGGLIYSTTPASFQFKAATVDAYSYFQTKVFDDIVIGKACIVCHRDGGAAESSKLHFLNDTSKVQQNYDIFAAFYKQQSDAKNYVLTKVSGGNGHGGGSPLPAGTADYQTFSGFLDLLGGASTVSSRTTASLFDAVANQSTVDTLRDASLLLAGRLPTAEEITAVSKGGDTVLKTTLLAMMKGAHFHKFLKDGADDRLFLRGNEDFNLADDCPACFPGINTEYWRLKDSTLASDRTALNLWMSQLNYSFVEAPLELIAYVAENNKPYTEILTADYDMLTPALNSFIGGTAVFPAGAAATDFAPGKITDYHLRDSQTVLVNVSGATFPRITTAPKLVMTYPHVGVLTSKSFLSRYPTTATNRNRARARWTYYHFLGVDIEALAKRTTDPVALADTNNPTMNNPACTVCHSVLDPVAGTYQDYSDNGIYRLTLNGTDSLDRNYKVQTNPKLYVTGDTWYRDMRVPGFEGAAAPGYVNSPTAPGTSTVRWLADLIAKDKRFATATVKFWWPAVMDSELLNKPEATEDANYQAKLTAYDAQQAEIDALADKFTKSGLLLKNLLADMVLSPWYRADKLSGTQTSSLISSARSVAAVSGEKLLTPEALARKTAALTGFNWNGQLVAASNTTMNGLEFDYNTFYGGIDGFALKQRARTLTPMMNNVAAAHAMEASCPVVLGDFIRPDGKRLLFNGLSPWVTPLTEAATTQQITSLNETDFKSYSIPVYLQAGSKQLLISELNDGCDYASSATTCKADKNLVIDSITIKKPNGQSTTMTGSSGTFGTCAANTGNNRLTLYSSCSAAYNYTTDQSGTHTITVSLAAKQQAIDQVIAGLNIETTGAAATSSSAGATAIKNKLIELHYKLLGQTLSITSPEVAASYDLLVQTWTGRKATNSAPSLLQSKTLACDWSTDIGFIGTLGTYPGSPLTNGRYNTAAVTTWLNPQAQDALLMKQSWTVVMAYLLSHYDYLHE